MICAGGDFPSGCFFTIVGERVCPYQRKDKQKPEKQNLLPLRSVFCLVFKE